LETCQVEKKAKKTSARAIVRTGKKVYIGNAREAIEKNNKQRVTYDVFELFVDLYRIIRTFVYRQLTIRIK
jgi:hypothetical protein